jgi:hypothetical protein
MYTGRQHVLMMSGVRRLREGLKQASFDVSIISAGYGLISEARSIAPYDITFQGKGLPWARDRGTALKIPSMTRELLSKYQVVFFLLGKEYLSSLGNPSIPEPGQKFIYFGTAIERFRLPRAGVVVLPAAQAEATRYGGAGVTGIKGRMFDLFAKGMADHPERWSTFIEDRTANTLLDVMSKARWSPYRQTNRTEEEANQMELMEAFDPIGFEEWIRENFTNGADLNGGSQSLALQRLMANAVMDPQVTILSHAVAETGIDEIQARMTIALMHGFLLTRTGSLGVDHV